MTHHTATQAAPSLNEWANFLDRLNRRKEDGQPFLKKDVTPGKMIRHLEVRLSSMRRYGTGRQLRLFAN